ncbi:MAG: hypothetical protein ACFFDI_02265 [Promethearchaeota archaeon]
MSKKNKILIFLLVAVVLITIFFPAVVYGWLALMPSEVSGPIIASWELALNFIFFMPFWSIPLLSIVGIIGAVLWRKRAREKREIAERERKRKIEEETMLEGLG